MRKKTKKILVNIISIIIGIFLTYFFVFRTLDFTELTTAISDVQIHFFFIALLCMGGYLIFEALNVRRTMKVCEDKSIPFLESFCYTSTGFFFSAITPSSVGGQPMQLVLMHKKGHKVEHSSLALLIEVIGAQSAAYIYALLGLLYCYITKIQLSKAFIGMFVLGLIFSFAFISFLFIAVFHSKFIENLLKIIFKKNIEKRNSAVTKIQEYARNATYIKTHVPSVAKITIRSFLKMGCYNAIPYFVCLSLNITPGSIIKIILLQSMLYIAVGFVPIPGAMGINEGLFNILYTSIVFSYIGPITIITRLANFYIPVLLTGLISYITFHKFQKDNTNQTTTDNYN
ncbi:MAG: hypothetical protein BKP49_08700 [Treponema sp. CETP13]|nr:MAG: hypothetical protein BKP49_08700 [Treponema sp. CETP13]